jgi:hypothetical protein
MPATFLGHDRLNRRKLKPAMILKANSADYGFFDPAVASLGQAFRERYCSATPFPHIVLDDFLDPAILERCVRDFPDLGLARASYSRDQENLKFEFVPERLSAAVRSLFYSLNSAPFIGFLEQMTGVDGLIPDPHFLGAGLHQVGQGGHLNIHADFNRHHLMNLERRLNLLIYLNKDWREEYGGCLELWDEKMQVCHEKIVPLFNRCVIFNTSSTSFHGNPEPVNHPQQRPRRSIAMYYYTATWDTLRTAHSTRFQVRPDSYDAADMTRLTSEIVRQVTPPFILRALRKVVRSLRGGRVAVEQ